MRTPFFRLLAASLALAPFAAAPAAAQGNDLKPSAPERDLTHPAPAPSRAGKQARPRAGGKADLAPGLLQQQLHGLLGQVLHERDAAGAEWARGADWKARFDAGGVCFVPFLGSSAPRSFPLGLRLDALRVAGQPLALVAPSGAQRDGESIVIEHGSLSERYALAPQGLEQSFVVPALATRGELVLELALETELGATQDEQGLLFANELGGVRYGRATAIDALGRAVDAPLELADGALRIRVPQEFVAEAVLPLVVDPGVSTWSVATSSMDELHPDIAYLSDFDQYEVVWEEAFNVSDHDLYALAFDSQGVLIPNSGATIDASFDYWAQPRIASYAASETFLVAAQRGLPSSGARSIVGRILTSPSNVVGPVLQISGSEPGDKLNPDVCGDRRPGGGFNYCVVWERAYAAGDHDIHAQWLTPGTGSLVFPNTVWVDNSGSTLDQHPSVSKFCSNTGLFSIVWEREVSATDHDIHGARYGLSGTQFAASTPLWVSVDDARHPSTAAGLDANDHWLLAFQLDQGDWDVVAATFSGTTLLDATNVSAIEDHAGSGAWTEDQTHVAAATDGDNFELAYSESFFGSSTDHDVFLATLGEVDGLIGLGEAHVQASASFTLDDYPRLCSARSGGGAKGAFTLVWQDTGSATNHGDVFAARFVDQPVTFFCFPGWTAGLCPCNNAPLTWGRGCDNSSGTGGATFSATGAPSLAADTLHFQTAGERPTATTVLLSGSATTDVAFGQGRRCVGGTLKRLYVKAAVGGAINVPAAGDASIHTRSSQLGDALLSGFTRYYMAYYRDPVVLGGCSSAATFNSTPAGAVTWRP